MIQRVTSLFDIHALYPTAIFLYSWLFFSFHVNIPFGQGIMYSGFLFFFGGEVWECQGSII